VEREIRGEGARIAVGHMHHGWSGTVVDPNLIESLNALAAKLDALLEEARATRELLQSPRPTLRVESIPTVEAAKVLGCSLRRVEQLLHAGVLDSGRRYGKRGMVTIESVERAMRAVERPTSRVRRSPERERGWKPIDRARLR